MDVCLLGGDERWMDIKGLGDKIIEILIYKKVIKAYTIHEEVKKQETY